jgi:hypothetical protein
MSRRRYSQYSCGRSVYHFQSYHGFANFAFVNNEGTHCERGARLDGDADRTIEAFSDHICHGVTQMQINALESLSSADASVKERHSTTFAKIASPSRSGSLATIIIFEITGFIGFYF